MPKGPSTASVKLLAKQEIEDVQARALASVADALEAASSRRATSKIDSAGPTSSDGECCQGEKFTIYLEVEKNRGLVPTVVLADRAVLAYAWTEEIIKDHLDRDIPDIKEIIILRPTACLIFKGRHGAKEGYTKEDVSPILDRVNGGRT